MTAGLSLGAPGVYRAPPRAPAPGLAGVRLDVTGFVGVAYRGPVGVPVAVTSWSQFLTVFGGLADSGGAPCPGLLPRAVQAFFGQGGEKACVLRIGPVATDPVATARFTLPGLGAEVTAANEGRWGGLLRITLRFDVSRTFQGSEPSSSPDGAAAGELALPDASYAPVGSLLRVGRSARDPLGTLHWVRDVVLRATATGGREPVAVLDPPPPPPSTGHAPGGTGHDPGRRSRQVAVITATVSVVDADPQIARAESLTGLGLHPAHPRHLPRVLATEATLVRAGAGWDSPVLPPAGLPAVLARLVHGGLDRFAGIDRSSLFDDGPADADLLDADLLDPAPTEVGAFDATAPARNPSDPNTLVADPFTVNGFGEGRLPHRGIDAMGRVEEIGLLCAPDLTWSWRGSEPPAPPEPMDPVPPGVFVRCAPDPTSVRYPTTTPVRAHLDPQLAEELAEIVSRQQRLVDVAVLRHRFVALLDVPSRLAAADVEAWRAGFDTSFAAAYHPWLGVPGPDPAATAVLVPPSAFAAGIVAARERRLGLPWGPAGELAGSAVTAADAVTDALHAHLHRLGVNVFRAERDGFRLTAARTLSSDPNYRQLSVRRLVTMIMITVEQQSQWLVFEPNTADLRAKLFHSLTEFLGVLFRSGAFAGDSQEQSFFVRCDDGLNPAGAQAQGRLIAEIGVAPASPLEYIVLRLSQDADGGVQVVQS